MTVKVSESISEDTSLLWKIKILIHNHLYLTVDSV